MSFPKLPRTWSTEPKAREIRDYLRYLIDRAGQIAPPIVPDRTVFDFHILTGTWSENSPSSGYVAWANVTLTYKGITYSIADGNTNLGYIWWDYSLSTTTFQTSASRPTLAVDDLLVAVNVSGSAVLAWNASQITAEMIRTASLSAIVADMGVLTAGQIQLGTGVLGTNFTGLVLDKVGLSYGGSTWHLLGLLNEVLQFGVRATDGRASAGAGHVIQDVDGLHLITGSTWPGYASSALRWEESLGGALLAKDEVGLVLAPAPSAGVQRMSYVESAVAGCDSWQLGIYDSSLGWLTCITFFASHYLGATYYDMTFQNKLGVDWSFQQDRWQLFDDWILDLKKASATTLCLLNSESGQVANLDVENNITLGGTVDAVDLAAFKTAYDAAAHLVRADKDGDGDFDPLTSTSWDGDKFSTETGTINWNTAFGVPAAAKMVKVHLSIKDSGASGTATRISLAAKSTTTIPQSLYCVPHDDFGWTTGELDVPISAAGTSYYNILASGSETMDIYMRVIGWYL